MLQQIKEFDGWLIVNLESVCNRIQRWTGISSTFWTEVIQKIEILLLFSIACTTPGTKTRIVSITVMTLEIFGSFFLKAIGVTESERDVFLRLSQGLANPAKKNWFSRLLFSFGMLCWTARDIHLFLIEDGRERHVDELLIAYFFISILSMYLGACDPLPPQQSVIKNWFRNLGARIKNIAPRPSDT